MFKRLILALAFAGLLSPAQAAGTISLSLSQQFDQFGKVLAGCRLNIIRAGSTSTPQDSFKDSALTLTHPNPIICDAAGRLPQFFLADGTIKVRLTDKNGVNQNFPGGSASGLDGILVVGPSGGGGGGSTVDPTTIIATGDVKARYGTGVLTGFVRLNGRTIGSATSGASERANADCEALFEYLWDTDANLSVSTGRGVSSAADWAANKTITLPDSRGRVLAALDDMGNSAAGRLSASFFGASAIVLGAVGGAENHTLTTAELAAHSHINTLSDPGHSHTGAGNFDSVSGAAGATFFRYNTADASPVITKTATTGITINNASAGGGSSHAIVQPTILITIYMKL